MGTPCVSQAHCPSRMLQGVCTTLIHLETKTTACRTQPGPGTQPGSERCPSAEAERARPATAGRHEPSHLRAAPRPRDGNTDIGYPFAARPVCVEPGGKANHRRFSRQRGMGKRDTASQNLCHLDASQHRQRLASANSGLCGSVARKGSLHRMDGFSRAACEPAGGSPCCWHGSEAAQGLKGPRDMPRTQTHSLGRSAGNHRPGNWGWGLGGGGQLPH